MGSSSAMRNEDLRVFHNGLLQGEDARQFADACVAEMTHLPTGVPSGRGETVTVPAGMTLAETPGEPILLHVVTGRATLTWGADGSRSAVAGPGDTVLIPAGVGFRVLNASQVAEMQLLRVRGS